ncbi:MAG: hypothetical protein ACRCX8_10245 [Sarcina sp.]
MKRINRNNMEVAIIGRNQMIGRSKGPVTSIKPQFDKAINEILEEDVQVVEEVAIAVGETNNPFNGINLDDYYMYCKWMIKQGNKPSIYTYKRDMEYYK